MHELDNIIRDCVAKEFNRVGNANDHVSVEQCLSSSSSNNRKFTSEFGVTSKNFTDARDNLEHSVTDEAMQICKVQFENDLYKNILSVSDQVDECFERKMNFSIIHLDYIDLNLEF